MKYFQVYGITIITILKIRIFFPIKICVKIVVKINIELMIHFKI